MLPAFVRETVDRLENEGRTTMIVRRGDEYLGVIGLMDTPRKAAAETLVRLREIGIRRMVMISGDNQRVADAIARAVGLDEAYGDLMPDDKVETIKALSQEEYVAMVGDGVNDSAALAAASVGIAVHGGAEASLQVADVYLNRPGLHPLRELIDGARMTNRVIVRNLLISLCYNLLAAGLALAGLINPLIAAVLMPISSLTVLILSFVNRSFQEGRE